jgi:hypothetical protein
MVVGAISVAPKIRVDSGERDGFGPGLVAVLASAVLLETESGGKWVSWFVSSSRGEKWVSWSFPSRGRKVGVPVFILVFRKVSAPVWGLPTEKVGAPVCHLLVWFVIQGRKMGVLVFS